MPVLSNSIDLLRQIKSQLSHPRTIVPPSQFRSEVPKQSEKQLHKRKTKTGRIQLNKKINSQVDFASDSGIYEDNKRQQDQQLAQDTARILNQLKEAMTAHQLQNQARIDQLIQKRQHQLQQLRQGKNTNSFGKVFQMLDQMQKQARLI